MIRQLIYLILMTSLLRILIIILHTVLLMRMLGEELHYDFTY